MKWLTKVITDQSLYNEEEVLYISKSKKLIKSLRELDLDVLYDPILNPRETSKLETISKAQSERLAIAKNVMIAYIMQEEKACDPKMHAVVLEGAGNFKLNARDLVIYPFLGNIRPEIARDTIKTRTTIMPENVDEDIRIIYMDE